MVTLRWRVVSCVVGLHILGSVAANAQSWPGKPIRMVVGFPPGAGPTP